MSSTTAGDLDKGVLVKFEIYKDKAGEFRFRIRATNGNVLASSEGYSAKASAQNAIDRIKSDAAGADVDDQT
ncbi:YegP family protein [Cellulomonas soli]